MRRRRYDAYFCICHYSVSCRARRRPDRLESWFGYAFAKGYARGGLSSHSRQLEQEDIEVTLSQDPKGLVDVWSEDAVRFKPGSSPTLGKQAIAAETETFHTQYPELKVLNYAPTSKLSKLQSWTIEVGSAEATYKMSAKGNPVSVRDKGMRLLKRQSDGSWKFALVGLK